MYTNIIMCMHTGYIYMYVRNNLLDVTEKDRDIMIINLRNIFIISSHKRASTFSIV